MLEVSLLAGCAVNCSYCCQSNYINAYAQRGDFAMSLETFERCLSTVPQDVEIVFAGMAEPFLNMFAVDMIRYVGFRRPEQVSVYSTLVGLDSLDVLKLGAVDFKEFCIHVPDDSGQMHVKIDEAYLRTFSAACAVLPKRHFTCIGKPHPALAPLLPRLNDDTPGLISRAGNLPKMAIPRKTGRLKRLPCMEHNVLLPNGDVVLCCMDYSLKSVLGNLTRDSYADIFKGREFKRILRGLEDESEDILCRTCEIAEKAE